MKYKSLRYSLLSAAVMLFGSLTWAGINAATESEEEIVYSWEGAESGATETGGQAVASDGQSVNMPNPGGSDTYYTIRLNGKKDFSTDVVTITLDKALKAGDEISVTAYRNKNAADKTSGFLAKFDKGGQVASSTGLEFVNLDTSDDSEKDSNRGTEPNTCEFEVPTAAEGSTVITMTRSHTSTNLFITKLVISSSASGGDDPQPDQPDQPVVNPDECNLEWDYTEKDMPTVSPDNGLYFVGYVNDPVGTNNGMHGVKLNTSGNCYFAKQPVAGVLTLTFGNRKSGDAYAVNVYEATIDEDGKGTKGALIGEVSVAESPGTGSIDIPANVTGIWIERKTGSEGVLQKIVFKVPVPRTFVDFEITNQELSTTFDPTTLPEGVTFSGNQRNDKHGYDHVTLVVPVDGTVKFTIGGCQYANPANCTVTNSNGDVLATPNLKTAKCYHEDGSAATYIYTGEPATLTFSDIAYLPYFKAEATEVTEATITYKDQNGNELGTKTVFEGDAIGEVPFTETDITLGDGEAFRGWVYNSNGLKVQPNDVVNGNTTVKALVTPVESVGEGSIQTYDFTKNTFYPEDHETCEATGGQFHDSQHGWDFAAGSSFAFDVAGKAQIVITYCQYGSGTTATLTDGDDNVVEDGIVVKDDSGNDGATTTINYPMGATRLTLTFDSQTYIHKIEVFNVSDFLEKDEASGYYIVPAGDAAGLVMALNTASSEEGAMIFLPDGTYDLGETVLTSISGKNVSIIGQSAEKTIIKNAPPTKLEGLGSADLLVNTGEGLYMQDITLQNALDYYNAGSNGRAPALHDKGTKTICKNVWQLSYQDTYYSHKVGGLFYFDGGEIHGTVDYMCGNGRVYFNEVKLVNERRSSATMSANSELYVFNNCTVENNADSYNLGRAWSDNPVCIWLNTTLQDTEKLIATRWNLSGINCDYSIAGEYNTMNENGADITPAENNITFTKQNTSMNTILDESALETYSIENVLGEWAAEALEQAQQIEAPEATIDGTTISWSAVDGATAYAIFCDGEFLGITTDTTFDVDQATGAKPMKAEDADAAPVYTIRAANARGGFGEPKTITVPTAIKDINAQNSTLKVQSAKFYNAQGVEVNSQYKGVVITVETLKNGKSAVTKVLK
jgi:hypothetical protein